MWTWSQSPSTTLADNDWEGTKLGITKIIWVFTFNRTAPGMRWSQTGLKTADERCSQSYFSGWMQMNAKRTVVTGVVEVGLLVWFWCSDAALSFPPWRRLWFSALNCGQKKIHNSSGLQLRGNKGTMWDLFVAFTLLFICKSFLRFKLLLLYFFMRSCCFITKKALTLSSTYPYHFSSPAIY